MLSPFLQGGGISFSNRTGDKKGRDMSDIKDTLDELFEDSLSDKQKEEKAYDEAKVKALEEIRGQNEKAMLQEALDKAGLDIEVTGKVEWNPGDPVENNAHMMLKDEFIENAPAEEVKKHYPYMFRATDGTMRDMRFTAPELFPKDEENNNV